MIATAVMYQQLSYVRTASLGYEKDHVLVLNHLFREDTESQAEALRLELLRYPDVQEVAFGSLWPTRSSFYTVSIMPEGTPPSTQITAAWYTVDDYYIDALGFELASGRGFSERAANDTSALVVNETAVREFGWTEPLGKQIFNAGDETPLGTVIGVVRDFHDRSLVDPVRPVVLSQEWWRARQPILKVAGSDRSGLLGHVEEVWRRVLPDRTFDYTFLDQAYEALYRGHERLNRTIALFAALALGIACLGLLGVSAFTMQQRTKEIGVRKVLGATGLSITALLTVDFLRLVATAYLVAVPAGYVAMERWLSGFAYRVEVGPVPFLLVGITALAIAFLTVAFHALKAATAEPVDSLRYE